MTNDMKDTSIYILDVAFEKARSIFKSLSRHGSIEGCFDDAYWKYKGKNLLFTPIGNDSNRAQTKHQLGKIAGMLARCFVIDSIKKEASGELVVSRLNAFRYLSQRIGLDDSLWSTLTPAILNNTVRDIQACFSTATTYHRASSLKTFANYINRLHININSTQIRFNKSFISWNHGIPNPIRSSIDPTSDDWKARADKLYDKELHVSLAKAYSTIKFSPDLEPRQGYDLIRLEALCFIMSLGIRVGEVCSLPVNALTKDSDTGHYFVRVATEKGAIGAATAVAEAWVPALNEAYVYLLESCKSARDQAKEIESSGFTFVEKRLISYRKAAPLLEKDLSLLKAAGLKAEDYYFIHEIVAAFQITAKELVAGSRFQHCSIKLPRLVSSRLALWIDERMSLWDWNLFAKYKKSTNSYHISVYEIGKHCKASKASITKAKWFINELKAMLALMENQNAFAPAHYLAPEQALQWRIRWAELREGMLAPRSGSAGTNSTAINLHTFKNTLEDKYLYYLSTHFKEQLGKTDHPTDTRKSYIATDLRPGQESRLSDHLIVVWENQFSANTSFGIIPRPILRSDFYNYLSKNSEKKTIFERLDIRDSSGQVASITPHQIRRWVTTALLRSGPSEAAIDLWMGRKPRQSRQYDYRTAKERAEYVRELYLDHPAPPNDSLGRKVNTWRASGLPDDQIEDLVINKLQVLNFTPWGGCSRELYLSPCNKGLMCLRGYGTEMACPSFHVNLKDDDARNAIQGMKTEYERMLNAIYPNYSLVANSILSELNNIEPLDQHILFMVDMIESCKRIILEYKKTTESHSANEKI